MITQEVKQKSTFRNIPNKISDSEILMYLQGEKVTWEHVKMLKENTRFNDEVLSNEL